MLKTLVTLFSTLRLATATKTDLLFEIAALRQQLGVFQRRTTRPRRSRSDRLSWVWLSRNWAQWKSALVIVQPETVLRWHRAGVRAYWRAFSKGNPGRPRIPHPCSAKAAYPAFEVDLKVRTGRGPRNG